MNVSRIAATAGSLALALVILCCIGPASGARHSKMIEADSKYDGREVTLAVGDVLELSLPENPSTGFRWDFIAQPEAVCSLVKNSFEPGSGGIGSGGTHRWQFKAARSGSGQMQLDYRRPVNKDDAKEDPAKKDPAQKDSPARTFKLTVLVR